MSIGSVTLEFLPEIVNGATGDGCGLAAAIGDGGDADASGVAPELPHAVISRNNTPAITASFTVAEM